MPVTINDNVKFCISVFLDAGMPPSISLMFSFMDNDIEAFMCNLPVTAFCYTKSYGQGCTRVAVRVRVRVAINVKVRVRVTLRLHIGLGLGLKKCLGLGITRA